MSDECCMQSFLIKRDSALLPLYSKLRKGTAAESDAAQLAFKPVASSNTCHLVLPSLSERLLAVYRVQTEMTGKDRVLNTDVEPKQNETLKTSCGRLSGRPGRTPRIARGL
jgi:hypothetical protein